MINVLIADEHELFRLGVRHALPDDMEVVGEAATKEELSVLLRNSKPDIILINNTLLEGGERFGKSILKSRCLSFPPKTTL